jgi:hypothetical protein
LEGRKERRNGKRKEERILKQKSASRSFRAAFFEGGK